VSIRTEFVDSLARVEAARWNGITGTDYPFLSHEFLYGLEATGCTTARSGWQPCHLLLRDASGLLAVMPLYLKSHSWGEYVFDWSWAEAWERSGLQYYPKLVTAIPFTPATGPRLCQRAGTDHRAVLRAALDAVRAFAAEQGASSWHLLFPPEELAGLLREEGLALRTGAQFHWFNEGYGCFEDFLAGCSSRKRKTLRRERARVVQQGLTLRTLAGDEIGRREWALFHRFYQLTYARRSGHGGYLSRAFFTETMPTLGDRAVMVLAHHGADPVAGALYFRSADTLYGRYWGCEREFDCLHFEACYYRGIDYCIDNGLARFDPGAQGEHKIQRGFQPVQTWSAHWIADPALASAVAEFTRREAHHTQAYIRQARELLPFRRA